MAIKDRRAVASTMHGLVNGYFVTCFAALVLEIACELLVFSTVRRQVQDHRAEEVGNRVVAVVIFYRSTDRQYSRVSCKCLCLTCTSATTAYTAGSSGAT